MACQILSSYTKFTTSINTCGYNLGQTGGGVDREVFLNVKHGVEAKNYEDVSCVCVNDCCMYL